ncbi:MAG: hypothetical protein A2Z07_10530 [Armatimonadetes bacterium RBG_16_67_12]|nr:MAG: hypothetical protein A2Z07_10530 [Armatimonadetes bacterium RBG_16_67_12]
MIALQIIERPGAHLHRTLIDAMRSGDLRTFVVTKRGRKVTHKNPSFPGWMNWTGVENVIHCSIMSPQKPGTEWRLLHALIGRLADKYADRIHSIGIQFPDARAPELKGKRRRGR